MAKTYELDTTVSPSSLLARAKKAASANGAILVGDEGSGRFSHELVRGGKNGRHPQRRDPPPFLAHTIVSWAHVSWDNV